MDMATAMNKLSTPSVYVDAEFLSQPGLPRVGWRTMTLVFAICSVPQYVLAQVDLGSSAASTGEVSSAVGSSNQGVGSPLGAGGTRFVVPRISVSEIFTDNAALASTGKQAEQITEISPGIRISRNVGRIRGSFDYALTGRFYAQNTSPSSVQNNLNAIGVIELVENRAFVDLGAGIGRQTISANGVQAASGQVVAANQTESTNFRVSPYLRGNLSQWADYELRYSFSNSANNGVASSQVGTRETRLALKNSRTGSRLGWTLNASTGSSSYSAARTTEIDVLSAGLTYAFTPQLNLSATVGSESNNYVTADKVTSTTTGLGLTWTPTALTRIALNRQVRPFGDTFGINLSTRGPRTVWQYSDTQDVTTTPAQTSLGSLGNVYDIYYAQFETLEPDPIKRAALVEAFLQTNGINSKATVLGNFLTSAVSLQRRQNLSLALLGIRSTVTFLASRSATSRLDSISTAIDDLSNSSLVQQSGFSVNWGHRLTPESALNVNIAAQNSSSSAGLSDSSTRSATVGISTRLGLRTTAAFNARRVVSDSGLTPYNETAITGSVSVQF